MSYDELFHNAVNLYENGRLNEAENIFRQILETAPKQPEVLNLLGLIAQAQGTQSEACSLFMQAIRIKPNEAGFYYNLAFSFKLAGKYIEALDNFQKVITLAPTVKETYNEIALIFQHLGKIDEARKQWDYVTKLNPDYADAKTELAMSYQSENPVKAIENLELLSVEFPTEARIFYYLTKLYIQTENWDKAWICATKAKNLAPTSDEIRVLLGILSCHDNKFDNALIYFTKAELINPLNIAAKMGLADIYSRQNQFDEAETRYQRIIELEPDNFAAHQNYAEMLQRQNRLSEALDEYRKAVIINPQSADTNNNLALILRDLEEYEEALGLLFCAHNINQLNEEISVNIYETIILYYNKSPQNAKAIAENWYKQEPDNIFAEHLQASLKGQKVNNNQLFSQKLFDNFALNYEKVITKIKYTVPSIFSELLPASEEVIVDLGCGTGLIGVAIHDKCPHIIGVDISSSMLKIAQTKQVYQELVNSDIFEYLQKHQDFSYALAADVFCYIDDLEPLISLLKHKKILFSIEELDDTKNFALQPNGRYRHNPYYVEKLLQANGFKSITKTNTILRYENGKPVKGIIFKGE